MQSISGHNQHLKNIKSYRISLIVGVGAGGILGSAFDKTLEMIYSLFPVDLLTVVILISMYSISIILIICAIRFHIVLETTEISYPIEMSSVTLLNLVQGAISACAAEQPITDILDSLLSLVDDAEEYRKLSARSIREYSSKLSRASSASDRTIKASLKAIHNFPTKLGAAFEFIKTEIVKSSVFDEYGFEIEQVYEKTLLCRKGESGNPRITIIVSKNKQLLLHAPFICSLSANANASNDDFSSAKAAISGFFAEVLEDDRIIEFGLNMGESEDRNIQEILNHSVTFPIMRKIDEIIQSSK